MAWTDTEVETGAGVRVSEVEDFIARYLRGGGQGGISGEEALRHYDVIVGHLNPAEYEAAAVAAFGRMSVEQREQLAFLLRERSHQQGFHFAELSNANVELFRDPTQLARIVCALEVKHPGILRGMLTDGGPGGMGSMTREAGSLRNNLLLKATIGGIAAMALQTLIRTVGKPGGRSAEQL